MTYLQQTVVADAPVMKETMAAAHGLSSFCFCAAVAETAAGEAAAETAAVIAAASSGFYCFCASVAEMVASAAAASANPSPCSFHGAKRTIALA